MRGGRRDVGEERGELASSRNLLACMSITKRKRTKTKEQEKEEKE